MKHAGVELPAKVPESAMQHWEGNGWELTDAPKRPGAVTKSDELLDASPIPVDAPPAVDVPASRKPKTAKAPTGREED